MIGIYLALHPLRSLTRHDTADHGQIKQ